MISHGYYYTMKGNVWMNPAFGDGCSEEDRLRFEHGARVDRVGISSKDTRGNDHGKKWRRRADSNR